MSLSAALVVFAGAISIVPATVPAHGQQEAIITVAHPAMVHFQTRGRVAPQCQIVDHLRGPFDTSGVAGKTHCDRDLLLDSGTYKVRFFAPPKGRGRIKLSATPFKEIHPQTPQLEPGRSVDGTLHAQQQASFWIRVSERRFVTLHVAGRTAGAVELWRDGEWRTDVGAQSNQVMVTPEHPIYDWWIQTWLEAGDYLVTVYGTAPITWAKGTPSDALSVAYGFAPAPEERRAIVNLPETGYVAYLLPAGSVTALASLQSALTTPTDLALYPMDNTDSVDLNSSDGGCRIEPKDLMPECAAYRPESDKRHVLMVRGAPGTTVDLIWMIANKNGLDGALLPGSFSVPETGHYLTGTYELPPDQDAAPLSCVLESQPYRNGPWKTVARDFLVIGEQHPFHRSFNFDHEQAIWFQVADSGRYQFATGGGEAKSCELYSISDGPNGMGEQRVDGSAPGSQSCQLSESLDPGYYELRLFGDKKGVETLHMVEGAGVWHALGSWLNNQSQSSPAAGETPGKSSCFMAPIDLTQGVAYRIRTTGRSDRVTRLLMSREEPLALNEALPLFLEANQPARLPIAAGSAVDIRGRGRFTCSVSGGTVQATEGACHVPANDSDETLTLSAAEPVRVTLVRGKAPPALPPLKSYTAHPIKLPVLQLDQPQYFDFDRGESRSLLFTVKDAGLYHVETLGLLATKCALRTPVVTSLVSDQGSGRGRNCLIESYLRPGRYLATITTIGQSKGRGAVELTRRAPREATAIRADGETFLNVAAGDLIEQRLTIPRLRHRRHAPPPEYHLTTTARGGASVSCRLEDKDGWPLVPVPTSCDQTRTFPPGTYLWMQLPLTVESVRHTKIARVLPPVLYSGKRVHQVVFNQWMDAQLRHDGHDQFFFNLQADMDMTIVLTNHMQGTLYLINKDKSLKPVDVIPPSADASAQATPDQTSSDDTSTDAVDTGDDAAAEDDSGDVGDDTADQDNAAADQGDGDEDAEPPSQAAPTPPPPSTALPTGHQVHLPAGPYKLIAVHSQGDVGIRYRLFIGSADLAPGFTRDLAVPGTVKLHVPKNGTLRLKTSGETDVRCRIFDATGRLVVENSHNGDDWNCALAQPFQAGDYNLGLEDETQGTGTTTVSVEMPDVDDVGTLADGGSFMVGANVITGALPPVQGDVVQTISFTAPTAFSCALEDPAGAILSQQSSVTTCAFLLRPGAGTYHARVWTLGQKTQVKLGLTTRPIESDSKGEAGKDQIARAKVPVAGRYSLDAHALCLPDASHGLLRPCGPEASLEAGSLLVGSLDGSAIDHGLSEVVHPDDQPQADEVALAREEAIQRQHSSDDAIHLLQVTTPHGERTAPACSIEGGIRELLPTSCVAASRIGRDALARWWAPGDVQVEGEVTRAAAILPSSSTALGPGQTTLTWSGTTARYSLPSQPSRLDLTLPSHAWAIRLENNGAVGDLCVASDGFQRCVMSGTGGDLVLYSPDEPRADATLIGIDAIPSPVALSALYENIFARPGSLRFQIAASSASRTLDVTGAVHCLTMLADGSRVAGCQSTIPAGVTAQLAVEHDGGALRATLGDAGDPARVRFGQPVPSEAPQWIPWSKGVTLTGNLVNRDFTILEKSVVHVRAESGVCALVFAGKFLDTEGFGGSCTIDRLLTPGEYRVLVRPFGRVPLSGLVQWTTEPVTELTEGIGPEAWVAPSQTRLYTFETKSAGKVGLGVQVPAETLDCAVMDASQHVIGRGCQQFLQLDAGTYVLSIRAPAGSPATRFKPVLVGLAGASRGVPAEYLRDFFKRIGVAR